MLRSGDGLFFRIRRAVRLLLLCLLISAVGAASAAAQTKNVKIMLDWIIQGTHAPFFIAQEKGYYKAEGVTVDTIDAGRGATNVAVTVAVQPQLFGPMLRRGEVDGTGGFTNSNIPAALELGFKLGTCS
jgi:hypothetical protein